MKYRPAEIEHRRAVITFGFLREVPISDLIDLHTDPRVLRHLPLAREQFDKAACRKWLAGKEGMWAAHGYGPWAIFVDGAFAGWGGLQPENGDADLALVLAAAYWGNGAVLCRKMLRVAFDEMGLESVTALLPLGRVRAKGMQRLGFQHDGQINMAGVEFYRYRCGAPDAYSS